LKSVFADMFVISGIAALITGGGMIHPAIGWVIFGSSCLIVGIYIFSIDDKKKDKS